MKTSDVAWLLHFDEEGLYSSAIKFFNYSLTPESSRVRFICKIFMRVNNIWSLGLLFLNV